MRVTDLLVPWTPVERNIVTKLAVINISHADAAAPWIYIDCFKSIQSFNERVKSDKSEVDAY